MKSRKKKASLFETIDERTLNFKQGSTTEQQHTVKTRENSRTTGLLRVSVMKASVNARHQKLLSSLQRSSGFNHNGGCRSVMGDDDGDSLLKQLKSLGQMFAPRIMKLTSSESSGIVTIYLSFKQHNLDLV